MRIAAFQPGDFSRLQLQPAQEYLTAHITPEIAMRMAGAGPAYTAWVDERPVACGGVYSWTQEGGVLWAWLSADAGRHFVAITRASERFIGTLDFPFLLALCRSGFEPASRWINLLGFEYLRTLQEYGPERVPHDCYLKVP